MAKMTGAELLLNQLMVNGVDTIFGLPGGQLDHFFDAMYKQGDKLRLYSTRHEQGAAYMAFGYTRVTGKVGTYAVVPGPGVLNSTAALCSAYATNMPVLCLTGQISLGRAGQGHRLSARTARPVGDNADADQMGRSDDDTRSRP